MVTTRKEHYGFGFGSQSSLQTLKLRFCQSVAWAGFCSKALAELQKYVYPSTLNTSVIIIYGAESPLSCLPITICRECIMKTTLGIKKLNGKYLCMQCKMTIYHSNSVHCHIRHIKSRWIMVKVSLSNILFSNAI